MAFVDRLLRKRQGLDAIPTYAGGSAQELIDEQQPQRPQPFAQRFLQGAQPSMADEYMATATEPTAPEPVATRPRSTNPFYERMMRDPSRRERPREVNPVDEVTKSSDYLHQVTNKPLSFRDKLGLVSQNIATNLGGTPLATRRQRDIAKAQGGLQQDLAVDKQNLLREQGQMVPFQLPDGSWTQVPAKSVGTLGSRQQLQGRTATDREKRTQGYLEHLDTMKGNERKKLTAQLYKSGAFNDSPEGLKYASEVLGVPNELKPSFISGQMRDAIDDDGNLIQVNRQSGATTDVVRDGKRVGAWTAEQFRAAEKGRNERADARNAQSEKNATIVAGGTVARMGDPAVHEKAIAELDKDIAEIDEQLKLLNEKQAAEGLTRDERELLKSMPRDKRAFERERRDEREKLGKITSGRGNQSTRPQGTSQPSQGGGGGQKGSFNLGAWKKAHPEASNDQIQSQRAKAKARNLAVVE